MRSVGGGVRQRVREGFGEGKAALKMSVEQACQQHIARASGRNGRDRRWYKLAGRVGTVSIPDGIGAVGDDNGGGLGKAELGGELGGKRLDVAHLRGEGIEFVAIDFDEREGLLQSPHERRAVGIGDHVGKAGPTGNSGAKRFGFETVPSGKTAAEGKDVIGGQGVDGGGTVCPRGGIGWGVGAEESGFGLVAAAHDRSAASRGRGGERLMGDVFRSEPGQAIGASRTTGKAQGARGCAKAGEHAGDVDAFATDLE